jgi:ankyrin repeat protein
VKDGIKWAKLITGLRRGETSTVTKTFNSIRQSFQDNWINCRDKSKDGYGRTALHWAVLNSDLSAVEQLVKRGAKSDIIDKTKKTAKECAAQNKEMLKIFEEYESAVEIEKFFETADF